MAQEEKAGRVDGLDIGQTGVVGSAAERRGISFDPLIGSDFNAGVAIHKLPLGCLDFLNFTCSHYAIERVFVQKYGAVETGQRMADRNELWILEAVGSHLWLRVKLTSNFK